MAAGRVLRAHGIHGGLRLRLELPWAQLHDCRQLRLRLDARGAQRLAAAGGSQVPAAAGPRVLSCQVTSARPAGDDVLVQLAGFAQRELACALNGAVVEVPRASLPPLAAGEVWGFELVGMAAIDEAGAALGQLVAVDGRGPQLVAQLRDAAGRSAMVPMVAGVMLQVRREQGVVVLRMPEGLWDL